MGMLKDRLLEELDLKGFADNTKIAYVGAVKAFIHYSKTPPVRLSIKHVHEYKLHLIRRLKRTPATINQHIAAIRFFFIYVLKKRWNDRDIPSIKMRRKLPLILSQDEIVLIFNSVTNIKHRTMLMGLYSCGLRKSELTRLKYQDIDSQRMLIHIRDSKGGKDRYVILSDVFLSQLRKYWLENEEDKSFLLFPGGGPHKVFNPKSVNEILEKALVKAGINKKVSVHSLRHSYATHLLESGVDLRHIQTLMGHDSITTTSIYTHVIDYRKKNIGTPLDSISSRISR